MNFKFIHNNFNVLDLEKSLAFYEKALGLKEVKRMNAEDGSFILVYLGDGQTPHQLELTWLRDRKDPYNLGENEFHLAFGVDDYEAAHAKHKEMGCIVYEKHMPNIKKWAALFMKTRQWAFILLLTRITTGWRLCL